MNKRTIAGLILTGATLVGGGLYSSISNLLSAPSVDSEVQVYRTLRKTMAGEVPVQDVVANPTKYITLGRLYDEMSGDSEFMARVEARDSNVNRTVQGQLIALGGILPLLMGVGGATDRRRKEQRGNE